eukprot:CAMPEP_0196807398 /NCGR_PEP_ID=MMETSP1362-20130617/7384_1 /TAXON_ID=163516 /ORGANISM="Leptocylindrus danicus, Strain CCMP1856" /LENGTH=271 /DNA_ID=CAMNT_0042181315 /DNA_START=93 /DNA_END=908 /DNA_ORIENTATION=+
MSGLTIETEPMPQANTHGAGKLQRAIQSAHSQAALREIIRKDRDIQDLFQYIPMSSKQPAESHAEGLQEALEHGWVVNELPPFSESASCDDYSSSIQTALKTCHDLADLEAAFCFDTDDILLNVLRRSSRSNIASECKDLLTSMMLGRTSSQDLYLNMIETDNNSFPVELEIKNGGPDGEGRIICLLNYTFPARIFRVTEDEDETCPDDLCHSPHSIARSSNPIMRNNGLILYEDTRFVENELLVFDAVVSDCFTFFGDGRIDSFRRMEIS